jgi:hypothetical protein
MDVMTTQDTAVELPRVEDYRADLSPDEILAAQAAHARSIAMQAYLHAFPAFLNMRQLTEFIQGRQFMAPGEPVLGGWFLMRKLADTSTVTVSPNVDTLYGATYLFLDQQGPMVLQVPPIPERYYSIALLDAYFNNFAIISPRTFGNEGGDYLIAPPGWRGNAPQGIKSVITAPTPVICLFQRIFIRNGAEYDLLHKYQDSIRLISLAQWDGGAGDFSPAEFAPVDLSPYAIQGMRMTRDPLKFFEYTNFYTGVNPPPAEDAGLMALFQTAGVGPGSSLPAEPHLRQAIVQGAADAQAAINARITEGPFRSGWTVPDPKIGAAGPHILSRATCQLTALGAFPPVEAIYFFAMRDGENRPLNGSQRYTLTFPAGQIPPLHPLGFWSLTMYNEHFLLVDNPLNRYIIRPDQPGLTYGPDGSLTLYLQAERPAGVPEGNWLPTPAGAFSVALRTYLPQAVIQDGTWFPPRIEGA